MCRTFHHLLPDLMVAGVVKNAKRLDVPVLVVWGDRDRLVPMPAVERAVAKIRAGKLEVIENCGHMPHIETPAEIIRLLSRFLGVSHLEVAA
jgi:pimeloyl-ACP methyl ester carboxylesterase